MLAIGVGDLVAQGGDEDLRIVQLIDVDPEPASSFLDPGKPGDGVLVVESLVAVVHVQVGSEVEAGVEHQPPQEDLNAREIAIPRIRQEALVGDDDGRGQEAGSAPGGDDCGQAGKQLLPLDL